MSRVRVTFVIEGDDDSHQTGVTGETYDQMTDQIMSTFGGEDIEFDKLDEPVQPHKGGGPKPGFDQGSI